MKKIKNRGMKKSKILVFLGITILFISFVVWAYYDILYPSYVSIRVDCAEIDEEGLNNIGYRVAGGYNPISDNITVFIPFNDSYLVEKYKQSKEYKSTIKHELIHYYQKVWGRSGNCKNKIRLYFNEVEAYTGENYPYWLYNLIY